jgi:hypothetical protein
MERFSEIAVAAAAAAAAAAVVAVVAVVADGCISTLIMGGVHGIMESSIMN